MTEELLLLWMHAAHDRSMRSKGLKDGWGKVYQRKYRASEKYKATWRKYKASERGRATRRKYEASEKGKTKRTRYNARRVFGPGGGYVGYAPTAEQAAQLTNLGREFCDRQKQSRA